jgi:hypothetical protein
VPRSTKTCFYNSQTQVKEPVELIIQSNVARTVGALDAFNQVSAIDLDGKFIDKDLPPRVLISKQADTIIRNYVAGRPGLTLLQTQLLQKDNREVILAELSGILYPSAKQIREVELLLRDKLDEPDLELIIKFAKFDLLNRDGLVRAELTGFAEVTAEQKAVIDEIRLTLEEWFFTESDFSLTGIDYTVFAGEYYFFLNVSGTELFPLQSVNDLQQVVTAQHGQKTKLHAISNIETVATSQGYNSYNTFSRQIYEKMEPTLKKDFKRLIEQSNL